MTESKGSQSFGPESTNPRLRRAYADAKLVQLGQGAASFKETQIAVNAAIGTRKGQAAQFEHRFERAKSIWPNLLGEAHSMGNELAHPDHTVDEIMQRAEAIGTEHRRHDLLVQTALWNVVKTRSWNKDIPVEKALEVAKRMTPDRTLGNSLADVGKYLGEERGMEERGYAVLDYAAEVFTTVWDKAKDEGKLSVDLFDDYARVAGLQDWAGDPEGAHITAQAVVPRLLEWEETGALEDEDDHHLDFSKESLLLYLREPESPLYISLYNTLRTEDARERMNRTASGNEAMGLLREGKVNEALDQVRDDESRINFTLRFIPYLAELIEEGDREKAAMLLETVKTSLPDEFEGDHSVYLGFTPLIDILVELDRYELLAAMVQGTVAEEENGDPYYGNADMHSMRAGAVIFHKKALEKAEEFKGFLPDRLRDKAQEGVDIAQNPPEWLQ